MPKPGGSTSAMVFEHLGLAGVMEHADLHIGLRAVPAFLFKAVSQMQCCSVASTFQDLQMEIQRPCNP